jgi:transcriptional regulator with XRE-family HTH domain
MPTAARPTTVPLNLPALMRAHRITIRELARRMGVTMKAVRAVRARDRVDYPTYCDFAEAVTGTRVFNRARYDAMSRQS